VGLFFLWVWSCTELCRTLCWPLVVIYLCPLVLRVLCALLGPVADWLMVT
jgi:hypothetical protein